MVTTAWQGDTGHLILRELAARSGLALSRLTRTISPSRARAAELIARGHLEILIGLDPDNLLYRHEYLEAHAQSPGSFVQQADWRAAQSALVAWDRAYGLMRERDPNWSPDFRHAELPLWIAGISARLGDLTEAQRWLAEVAPRLDFHLRAEAHLDELLERGRAAQYAAFVALLAPDWPEAARLVEEARGRIDALEAARPGDPELTQRVALMRGLEGVLLARQHQLEQAARLIGSVVPALPAHLDGIPRLNPAHMRRLILEAWCDVLDGMGRRDEALTVAETMLTAQEAACMRDPGDTAAQELLAADLVRVAGLLRPDDSHDATRQRDMLERASSIIASARAQGAWQTFADQAVETRLKALFRPGALKPGTQEGSQ